MTMSGGCVGAVGGPVWRRAFACWYGEELARLPGCASSAQSTRLCQCSSIAKSFRRRCDLIATITRLLGKRLT